MDINQKIDLTGLKMSYSPYPVDRNTNNYINPTEEERKLVYEISGEAVRETLIYFEECNGNTNDLVTLLNQHMVNSTFLISRNMLLNQAIWWNNEFYFYFIMFCKKIIGRFDWHFGENSDALVSVHHRLYEKGSMQKTPWGEDENGKKVTDATISNALINFIFIEDSFFIDSSYYLSLLNKFLDEKYSLTRDMFQMETIFISLELWYYTIELFSVITNKSLDFYYANTYKFLEKIKITDLFLNMPKTDALESIFELNTRTSIIMDYQNTIKKGQFKTFIKSNQNFDFNFFGIYKESIISRHTTILTATFFSFIYVITGIFPEYTSNYTVNNSGFTLLLNIKWSEPNKNMKYYFISGLLTSLLYFILTKLFPVNLYFYTINTIIFSSLVISLMYLKFKFDDLSKKFKKQTNLNNNQYKELEYIARKLSDTKISLENKVKERTVSLEKAIDELRVIDHHKTYLFANMSHEFRTPLSLIISPIQCLKKGIYGSKIDKDHTIFNTIENNANKIYKLINNITDWLNFEIEKATIQYQYFSVNKLLSLYASQFESSAIHKNIEIKLELSDENPTISVDIELFESVIYNLFGNAIKYTDKGSITITTEVSEDEVLIIVSDTGIGISNDTIHRIFDPFYRVENNERKYEGTGLGLAITKDKINALNGTITCNSILGVGSAFTITLPNCKNILPTNVTECTTSYIHINETIIPINNDTKMESFISYSLKKIILLVEDNAELSDHIKFMLSEKYNVITAGNGKEAINFLLQAEQMPDIIVSDMMMPEMDGFALLEKIKENNNFMHIPFIFLTAKNSDTEKITSIQNGAIDYILKPFNVEELTVKIDSIITTLDFSKNKIFDDLKNKINNYYKIETTDEPDIVIEELSKRENEILNYFIKGFEFKKIGDLLNISNNTINNHFQSIYKKLNVKNKMELFNMIKPLQKS